MWFTVAWPRSWLGTVPVLNPTHVALRPEGALALFVSRARATKNELFRHFMDRAFPWVQFIFSSSLCNRLLLCETASSSVPWSSNLSSSLSTMKLLLQDKVTYDIVNVSTSFLWPIRPGRWILHDTYGSSEAEEYSNTIFQYDSGAPVAWISCIWWYSDNGAKVDPDIIHRNDRICSSMHTCQFHSISMIYAEILDIPIVIH